MQVSAAGCLSLEVAGALEFQRGFVGCAKIRRSANKPWDILRKHIEDLPRSIPPRDALAARRKDRKIAIPALRQLAPLHQSDFGGEMGIFAFVLGEELRPLPPGLCATRADAVGKTLVHNVRNEKLRILGPAIKTLREANLFFAERLAVRFGRIVLVRRTVTDVAVENDEGWTALRIAKDIKRVFDEAGIVGVAHPQNVPAVALKP